MATWQEAEALWQSLVACFGLPRQPPELSPGELAQAIAQGRALRVDIDRDASGGGSVWFRRARAEADLPGRDPRDGWFCIAFPSPCRLTEADVQVLNANAWERWEDVVETAALPEV